jgi:hypothetical protein
MSANDNDTATHKWVRDLITTEIANQPKKAYEAAKAAAASGGTTVGFYFAAGLAVIFFGIGAGFAAQLGPALENLEGNQTVGTWVDAKTKSLTPALITICIGFACLTAMIIFMTSIETVILQNQGKIALGVAVFSFMISIMVYVIAIYTRTVPRTPPPTPALKPLKK